MNTPKITFVGAGNMASSIIGGLVKQGYQPDSLCASARTAAKLEALANRFGIRVQQDNIAAVRDADVVVLSVKPQVMKEVCLEVRPHLSPSTLIISIAAGIRCASLSQWLGEERHLVRCMPNTPAQVQMGASGLFAAEGVTADEKATAERILAAVGTVAWVADEDLLHAVTAVSGSGPAYFFLFLEAMTQAAVQQGLDPVTARQLAVQTAAGAARLAQSDDTDLVELRRRVTSPGGTTEKAIAAFEQHHLRQTVDIAMQACANRSRELAELLGR